jgi:hypothetical protein
MTAATVTLSLPDGVDDSIAVDEQFSDVFVVKLGHFSSGEREMFQHPRRDENLPNHCLRISQRVAGDVGGNGLDVSSAARRPNYSVSHLLS